MRWAHVGGPSHGLWLAGDPGGTVCHQLDFVLRIDVRKRFHESCKFRNHIKRSTFKGGHIFNVPNYQTKVWPTSQTSFGYPLPPFFARLIFLFFSMFTGPGVVPKNPPLKPGPQWNSGICVLLCMKTQRSWDLLNSCFFQGQFLFRLDISTRKIVGFPFEVHHVYRDFQGPIFECNQNHLYMEHVSWCMSRNAATHACDSWSTDRQVKNLSHHFSSMHKIVPIQEIYHQKMAV